MAEADLDVVIRSIAQKQIKVLTDAAKRRHGRLMGMAAKAKDKEAKQRHKHMAKATLQSAAAAARRLHVTADNAAESYARAMRKGAQEVAQPSLPRRKTDAKRNGRPPAGSNKKAPHTAGLFAGCDQ